MIALVLGIASMLMLALVLSLAWMLMIALVLSSSMDVNDSISFKYSMGVMIALVLGIASS